MKHFKKALAMITVIALLASICIVPVLADGFRYEAEAEVLNELKLMEGMGLGDRVNRLQGLIFAIKAAGKKVEVDNMSDCEVEWILANVVDADQIPDWGRKWTAYAVANGYTTGVDASILPKVKFAPLQEVSGTSFLVWILKIGMGYKDVGTRDAVPVAIEAGVLTLSQAMEIGPKSALIRDDAAGVLYGACKNGVCADGRTFIQSLIDAGFVTEKAAIAAGFIVVDPKPTELEVVDVTADNLKQLVIEFNMPIKEAGDEDNYIIKNEDEVDAVIDDDSDFALQDDKKTVVITLTNEAAQQEVIDLTIRDIESESGLKLKETTKKNIQFFDNTIPKAVSAEVVGKYTIKVKFSEPIWIPDYDDDPDKFFSVDDVDYMSERIEKVSNDTEINVTLYSPLEDGTVSIEAKSAIRDYAGFGIAKKTFTLKVKEDESGPVVVGYKDAKPTEVTFIFDEDIELLEESDEDYGYPEDYLEMFYHTNRNNYASDLKVNGNELTIMFDDSQLPHGRAYI